MDLVSNFPQSIFHN